MTKKHFIALADHLRSMRETTAIGDGAYAVIVNSLYYFCQSQNPQFKRYRWIAYVYGQCGPSGGKVKGKKV